MSGCGKCGGDCGHCHGCGAVELNSGEIAMLRRLGQIPFLPVARKAEDPTPLFPEPGECTGEEYSLILQCLEKKGLISIDFGTPLKGYRCPDYPICGSFALTARGQRILELLDIQGIE